MNHPIKTALIISLFGSWQATALEFSGGDYEMLPDKATMVLTYLQSNQSDSLYGGDQQIPGNHKLDSQVALLRAIHAIHPSEHVSVEPQFILPYAAVDTGNDSSFLGDTSGFGDLTIGMPIKYSETGKDTFAIAPFLSLPTGQYNANQAINVGENWWRLLLQGVWIHHFNDQWALDTGIDVSWTTENDEYGAQSLNYKESALYEYQVHGRYQLSPVTQLSLGGGYIRGAESSIEGVKQNDALETSYIRANVSHFFRPNLQLQFLVGKDLKVKEGFKQDAHIQLRVGFLY